MLADTNFGPIHRSLRYKNSHVKVVPTVHAQFCIEFFLYTLDHYRFNQNYGVMGVLDRLHGTDKAFRRSKSHDRHVVLLGLSSARELYPDPPKGKGSPCHQAKATTGDGNFAEVSSCCM